MLSGDYVTSSTGLNEALAAKIKSDLAAAWSDELQALLLGTPAQRIKTPVFGCSLFDCNLAANP